MMGNNTICLSPSRPTDLTGTAPGPHALLNREILTSLTTRVVVWITEETEVRTDSMCLHLQVGVETDIAELAEEHPSWYWNEETDNQYVVNQPPLNTNIPNNWLDQSGAPKAPPGRKSKNRASSDCAD